MGHGKGSKFGFKSIKEIFMTLSFVVNNLANSELAYNLIQSVNKHPEVSSNIFFQNNLPTIIQPECLTMNLTGLSGLRGKAIAFDLESAMIIDNANINTENYIYLYDLEWLFKPINFVQAATLMNKFTVFARSESHSKVISNFLNKPIAVIDSVENLFKCLT